jgi:hypothetical protein
MGLLIARTTPIWFCRAPRSAGAMFGYKFRAYRALAATPG